MKLQQSKQSMIIGSVASLALMLAMGTVNAGNNNKHGASVSIFNTCELADTDKDDNTIKIKPVLRVTTTITDKSSGDFSALFDQDSLTVRATEKGKGRPKFDQVGDTETRDGALGVTKTDIQLCDGLGGTLVSSDTVSLNASVSVEVSNDNKGEYSNRCSDDPDTEDVNEGKIVVSPDELAAACMLP